MQCPNCGEDMVKEIYDGGGDPPIYPPHIYWMCIPPIYPPHIYWMCIDCDTTVNENGEEC